MKLGLKRSFCCCEVLFSATAASLVSLCPVEINFTYANARTCTRWLPVFQETRMAEQSKGREREGYSNSIPLPCLPFLPASPQ